MVFNHIFLFLFRFLVEIKNENLFSPLKDCDALCQYCFDYLSGNTLCQSSKSFLDGNKALIQKILSLIYRSIKYEVTEDIV